MANKEENPVSRRGFLQLMGVGIFGSIMSDHMVQLVEESPESIDKIMQIKDGAGALVELIKEVSRLQVSTWQQVPALALEADGRTGYSGHLAGAYTHRLWGLEPSLKRAGGFTGLSVDLNSGELIMAFHNLQRPADRDYVILLALDMGKIDATEVVSDLKEYARKPHWSYIDAKGKSVQGYDPEEQEKWRNSLRQEHGLPKPDLN